VYKQLVAGAAALVLLFAACGGDDDDSADDSGSAATETTAAQSTETTAAASAASGAAVDVASTSLGDVLVDAQGFTLYVFDNDAPDTSNCSGQCLDSWPPLIVDSGFTVGDGLDQSMFGTIQSASGTQLTVNQLPLYTFASDSAPGDVQGQGVGGVWWAVAPNGSKIPA
jgi:predicted lipoprotein with Yx(FWY)xxD motif